MSIAQEGSRRMDEGNFLRPYEDVRQWLDLVEAMGELKHIKGADWNLEIGAMAELIYRERGGTIPALQFDRIKGYPEDRKSTRLNSSHITISYAVFCLKK